MLELDTYEFSWVSINMLNNRKYRGIIEVEHRWTPEINPCVSFWKLFDSNCKTNPIFFEKFNFPMQFYELLIGRKCVRIPFQPVYHRYVAHRPLYFYRNLNLNLFPLYFLSKCINRVIISNLQAKDLQGDIISLYSVYKEKYISISGKTKFKIKSDLGEKKVFKLQKKVFKLDQDKVEIIDKMLKLTNRHFEQSLDKKRNWKNKK